MTYATNGPCSISDQRGLVAIDGVGDCHIIAEQSGDSRWASASADLVVNIERAEIELNFEERSVAFTRSLDEGTRLWATATPEVPLVYTLYTGYGASNSGPCRIEGSVVRFITDPAPRMSAACGIEVKVRDDSANYETPTPVRALWKIEFARWDVEILPIGPEVSYSQSGGVLAVEIHERTGDAYGIRLSIDNGAGCSVLNGPFADPYPSGRGQLSYTVQLILNEPGAGQRLPCAFTARGEPLDHGGGASGCCDEAAFEVVP